MPPQKKPTIVQTEFDRLTIGNSTQIIKAFIPFLEPPEQRMLGLMVRIMELNMTMDFFNRNRIPACAFGKHDKDSLLSEIKCYCTPEEQRQLDMMMGMLKVQQFQNMTAKSDGSPTADNLNILSGFLTPEQMKLYKEYEKML